MRAFFAILGIVAAAAVAGTMLLPRLVSETAIRTQIGQVISLWTGREISVAGDPVLSLFPEPRVTLNQLSIAGPGGMTDADVLSTESLSGSVRLLPLLIGEVELKSFELTRPVIRLIVDEDRRRNWLFDGSVAGVQLALAGDVPLGRFRFRDGTILVEDRKSGELERIDDLDLSVDWESVRQPFSLKATATWHGEPVRLRMSADRPFRYLAGEDTQASFNLESAPMEARFEGTARDLKNPALGGDFDITIPSLRVFMRWLGNDVGDGPALGPTSIVGTARYQNQQFTLSDANVTLDGNEAQGSLRLSLRRKPVIEGTLAADAIDLSPYAQIIADDIDASGVAWSDVKIDTSWLDEFTADLRLSARAVDISRIELSDAAASVLIKDGTVDVGLAQAGFYGGSLSGSLSMASAGSNRGARVTARLTGDQFDLRTISQTTFANAPASGNATMSVDLETSGKTAGELVGGLTGTLSAEIADGLLPGINLNAVANAINAGGTALADPARGDTAYRLLDATLLFGGHAALLQKAELQGDGFASRLAGTVGLDDGIVSLSAYMATDQNGDRETPFEIVGTVSEPQIVFDRAN